MKKSTNRRSGQFSISPVRSAYGELHLAGKQTSLRLTDVDDLGPDSIPKCITGTLHDLSKVTLVDCVPTSYGSTSDDEQARFYAEVFPHYVLEGRRHLDPDDRAVREIILVLKDAATLFYDSAAFGTVIRASDHIEDLLEWNKPNRPIPVGPSP